MKKFIAIPAFYHSKGKGITKYAYLVHEQKTMGDIYNLEQVDFIEVNHFNDFSTMAKNGYTKENTVYSLNGIIGNGLKLTFQQWKKLLSLQAKKVNEQKGN